MNQAFMLHKTKILQLVTGCIFFVLLFSAGSAFAQTRGRVEVIKDPRIDTLAARRTEAVKGGHGTGALSGSGFRVQIFTGPNRNDAFDAQAKFQRLYPDIRTYIIYNEPNFKIRVGDFRTRLEAAKLVQQIKPVFPVLFIIPEKINLPN